MKRSSRVDLLIGGPWAAGVLACVFSGPLAAQPASAPSGIYTCVDERGRRLTSDRPIIECTAKEQRVLNKDGSLKMIYPPILTVEERAQKEARERKLALERASHADAVRRDRNLMARYPDEAAHNRAREAALDTVRLAMRASALRMNDLEAERKPLLAETEFYVGRGLPAQLRGQLDANEAAMAAQRSAMQTQEAELVRINSLYDLELDRLRQLWGGAVPGSVPVVELQTGERRR
ncbi:MAG: hypothetical protein OEW22_10295 [Rubrivivax sp.]|nr:hypothetical protein [Rubrivivax sp.]